MIKSHAEILNFFKLATYWSRALGVAEHCITTNKFSKYFNFLVSLCITGGFIDVKANNEEKMREKREVQLWKQWKQKWQWYNKFSFKIWKRMNLF